MLRIFLILLVAVLVGGCRGKSETPTSVPHSNPASQSAQMSQSISACRSDSIGPATSAVAQDPLDTCFTMEPVPEEVFRRMQGKSWQEDCPVRREDLRYLRCLHVDLQGVTHVGEMVVNRRIAERVRRILKELYRRGYPIERMQLVDDFDADDERSMAANNSSCFNCRMVGKSQQLSKHAWGLAVDINPLYNPNCVQRDTGLQVTPQVSRLYADRTRRFDYKIVRGDLCWRLFRQYGFQWGGTWRRNQDYQHFEL